jgi:hypothetical protein
MAGQSDDGALFQKHRRSGLLLDANLLLLYQVGLFDERAIKTFPHTKRYTIEDFHLLAKLVGWFTTVVTTPNILTEVSNLSGKLGESNLLRFQEAFKGTIDVIEEKYCASQQATASPAFAKFGLTDAGIASLVSEHRFLVLTDDLRLANWLQSKGFDVLNFNHIRQHLWSERG